MTLGASNDDIVNTTAEIFMLRPSRPPNFEAEATALRNLADALSEHPETILEKLCDSVLKITKAGSAGVSILTTDDHAAPAFRWPAISGAWAQFKGGGMPRDASPCGLVIQHQTSLLCRDPQAEFPACAGIDPLIVEVLLAPFFIEGKAVGTVWALSHDPAALFEAEDKRLLESVAHFASAAWQSVRREEERRELQDRLNLTLLSSQIVGLWDWHIPEDRVFADPSLAYLFGVDPAAASEGASVAQFIAGIHVDDRERVSHEIKEAVEFGGPFSSEYRLTTPEGEIRNVIARGRCETGADGTPLRFPGVIVDVTEQRRLQAANLVSEAQFRRLAQAMPNHVWTANEFGSLDWFNEQVYAYSGAQPGSLDGEGWALIVHSEDLPAAVARWKKSLSTGEPYEAEFRLRRADGIYRWYIARALPLHWKPTQGSRWVGTNTDIEDQKLFGSALVDLNVILEEKIKTRTAELKRAEDALRQSQKMEAVGQLTGGLAHDFNNMLTGILGGLSLVRSRIAQGRYDQVERYVASAEAGADRAAALTHRLLAFSRQQTLDPKPTAINDLVAGMDDLIDRTSGPGIAVRIIADPNLWPTLVDAGQLESALLNLCINARDAMPDGGVLTIETSNTEVGEDLARSLDISPNSYVSLSVTDTGVGMPKDVIARAFDPFFTTKPIGQGTGLGLSMIYGFVKQSGGNVRIHSEVGHGTTVNVYLPRYIGSFQQIASVSAREDTDERFGDTVIIVDDEDVVRTLAAETLKDRGYTVIEAADGVSAMAALASADHIDLLVTDVGLPNGLNGRQVADTARRLRPELKVLFITGYAEATLVSHSHLDADMHVLVKPFRMDAFRNKVRDIIQS